MATIPLKNAQITSNPNPIASKITKVCFSHRSTDWKSTKNDKLDETQTTQFQCWRIITEITHHYRTNMQYHPSKISRNPFPKYHLTQIDSNSNWNRLTFIKLLRLGSSCPVRQQIDRHWYQVCSTCCFNIIRNIQFGKVVNQHRYGWRVADGYYLKMLVKIKTKDRQWKR
jgi:hypothetical protein